MLSLFILPRAAKALVAACAGVLVVLQPGEATLAQSSPQTNPQLVRWQNALSLYEAGQYKAAHDAFKALASEENTQALTMLAVLYLDGKGVDPDPATAAVWLYKAAELGDAQAQLGLAHLLATGRGTSQSASQAYFWSTLAVRRGRDETVVRARALAAEQGGLLSASERQSLEDQVVVWQPRR